MKGKYLGGTGYRAKQDRVKIQSGQAKIQAAKGKDTGRPR